MRHLLSHLSGIRHYEKVPAPALVETLSDLSDDPHSSPNKTSDTVKVKNEFENQEYLLNSFFDSVSKSLALFKDDELFNKPGNLLLFKVLILETYYIFYSKFLKAISTTIQLTDGH